MYNTPRVPRSTQNMRWLGVLPTPGAQAARRAAAGNRRRPAARSVRWPPLELMRSDPLSRWRARHSSAAIDAGAEAHGAVTCRGPPT
eukprot:365396-Chlamydomonas_euryale.AAC.11